MEQQVKKTLEDLYGQLSSIHLENREKQDQLNEVVHSIRTILDQPDSPQRLTLSERLTKSSLMFDVDHPYISSSIHKAVDILVDAGF